MHIYTSYTHTHTCTHTVELDGVDEHVSVLARVLGVVVHLVDRPRVVLQHILH